MRSKSTLTKSQWCLLFLLPIAACSAATSKVIYVDNDATSANDGSSWENAYLYLQDALADANFAEKPIEIRVAQGIYKPDQGAIQTPGSREATFRLINDVTLEGGYAGLDEPDPDARNVELYETIMSGDLNGDDVEVTEPCDLRNVPTRAENSYNVVTGSGTDDSAVLDGFTITAGNANQPYTSGWLPDPTGPDNDAWRFTRGAGMFNIFASPIVANCTFTMNSGSVGGGMFNYLCVMTLNDCKFARNSARWGGGMSDSQSSLTLTNCHFSENLANFGGGLSGGSRTIKLTDCTLIRNSADRSGGGMFDESITTLTNCAFIANEADQAGGLSSQFSTLTDCTFIANKARNWGGGMWSGLGDTVSNCIFSGNSASICGGAIYLTIFTDIIITNCTLTGNSAPNGNALASDSFFGDPNYPSNIELMNCIVWGGGNEIWNDGVSKIKISYSDIKNGQAGIYDPYGVIVWGQDNIDVDPLFADTGHWVDVNDPNVIVEPNNPDALWINGEYHLKSEAGRWNPNSESWVIDDVTSPCIDTGDPLTPVMYEPHPRGCFINMGAFGGTEKASKSPVNPPY